MDGFYLNVYRYIVGLGERDDFKVIILLGINHLHTLSSERMIKFNQTCKGMLYDLISKLDLIRCGT